MTDYRTLAVEVKYPDSDDWTSALIRSYDSDAILGLIGHLIRHNVDSVKPQPTLVSRYITDTPMLCTECNRWSEQQEYALDGNDKQAKCPLCHIWVYVEECEIGEI